MTLESRGAGATTHRPSTEFLPPSPRGRLIVLEGPEGTGKTSLSALLTQTLVDRGIRAVNLREPGGHPGAEALRDVLRTSVTDAPTTRGLLGFSTARAMLVEDILRPRVAAGEWIVLDRWVPSTYVYQAEEGVSDAEIAFVTELATRGFVPDTLFLLTAPPEVILERVRKRNDLDDAREQGLTLAKIQGRLQRYREVCARMHGVEIDTNRALNILVEDLMARLALPSIVPPAPAARPAVRR